MYYQNGNHNPTYERKIQLNFLHAPVIAYVSIITVGTLHKRYCTDEKIMKEIAVVSKFVNSYFMSVVKSHPQILYSTTLKILVALFFRTQDFVPQSGIFKLPNP
eukprot:snap_masked-scaffold_19-processed-gene-2.24-mRNA-1 protein AED:1.00 eAED:1.00 QI:0/0/0/0/1/1/2/0/103